MTYSITSGTTRDLNMILTVEYNYDDGVKLFRTVTIYDPLNQDEVVEGITNYGVNEKRKYDNVALLTSLLPIVPPTDEEPIDE